MEMKEKTDGNWCLALEMEKDEGEQVVVFPGLIHVKDGLAPPGEGSESPLQLDAQTRSRPKISMLGIYSAAIISFLLALSQAVFFHGPSILTQPTGHLSDYAQTTSILVEYTNFRDLADAAMAGLALPLEVAEVELVMTDMRVMIQFSNLKAREAMVLPVRECILEAKNATWGLQRLASKIGGAVDSITVVQAYASEKLEDTQVHKLLSWLISIFRRPIQNPGRDALDYLLQVLERLISEIELSNGKLLRLDACLTSIQELIAFESSSVSSARSGLLQDVWMKIGANRKELRRYDLDLALLKDLAALHKRASGRVTTALETLGEARHGMEGIKGRSKTPFVS